MADILSPTGIEKPLGAELHSRAMVNRNYDRINQIAIDMNKIKHVEWIRIGQNDAPANTPWGPGAFGTSPLLVDINKNGGFVGPGASNDQIKALEEGVYAFTWTLHNGSGTTESFWLRLTDPGVTFYYGTTPVVTLLNGETMHLAVPNIYLPANTTMKVQFSCGSANKTVNHRFKLTKGQG